MKSLITAILVLLMAVCTVQSVQQPEVSRPGFTVTKGRLLDANGNDFIARGVAHPYVWFPERTGAFADIASLGANAVRVVLGSGQRWGPTSQEEVRNVVALCKQSRLVCLLEVHDTTGFGEEPAAASLDQAVDYWITIRDALVGEEKFVLLNIGNEPLGNDRQNNQRWSSATSNAITRLRRAGFEHCLVVDAPNWGQDWQFIMRDSAAEVFARDPIRNTMFSVHMYGVFDRPSVIKDYLQRFVDARLAVLIGEFANAHSDGDPDEAAIMKTADQHGIGYFGWSWSGNSGGVEYLDISAGFNSTGLTAWGRLIFEGRNGIRQTAKVASVYASLTR